MPVDTRAVKLMKGIMMNTPPRVLLHISTIAGDIKTPKIHATSTSATLCLARSRKRYQHTCRD